MDDKEIKPDLSEAEPKPLTAEYAARLFFWSFRISQGNQELQEEIFVYLHHLRPHWRIDDPIKEEFKRIAEAQVTKFLNTTKGEATLHMVFDNPVSETLNDGLFMWHLMIGILNEEDEPANVKLSDITDGILDKDLQYLIERGRPRSTSEETPAIPSSLPSRDPFLSHFYYYGLEQHRTGLPEYDQLFRDVVNYALDWRKKFPEPNNWRNKFQEQGSTLLGMYKKSGGLNFTLNQKLNAVVELYKETHLQSTISLPPTS